MDGVMFEINKSKLGSLNFQIVAGNTFFNIRFKKQSGQVLAKELKRIVEDLEAMNEAN
jgi:hypothetical protein